MAKIWNEVVSDGIAFPQIDCLNQSDVADFFSSQTYCGVAEDDDTKEIIGFYIFQPNNVGRCAHIANASFAVSSKSIAEQEQVTEKLKAENMMLWVRKMNNIRNRNC